MKKYTLVFSNGYRTVIGEEVFMWIINHGAKSVFRIVSILDEDGKDILSENPEFENKINR